MMLSAHQPAYLPWLGYFEKIMRSDVFIFLDHVQYEKNSFINRNRIKSAGGPIWLTIPVLTKGHTSSAIVHTSIDARQPWREKHLRSISHNYLRAPCYASRYSRLCDMLSEGGDNLAEVCWQQLQFWLAELRCNTKVVRSSALELDGKKSDLILELCQKFKADAYLSGVLGKNYLDEDAFNADGISVTYQQFQHPEYVQLHGEFLPNLAIVDAWMNVADPLALMNRAPGVVEP